MAEDDRKIYVRSQLVELSQEIFRGFAKPSEQRSNSEEWSKDAGWKNDVDPMQTSFFGDLDSWDKAYVIRKYVDFGTYGPDAIERIIANVIEHNQPARWMDGVGDSKPSFEQLLAATAPSPAPARGKNHDKGIEL
jgi:hypothetical protein